MPDLNTTLKKYSDVLAKTSGLHKNWYDYNKEVNEWKLARGKKMSEIWMAAIKKKLIRMVDAEKLKIYKNDLKNTKNVWNLTYRNLRLLNTVYK